MAGRRMTEDTDFILTPDIARELDKYIDSPETRYTRVRSILGRLSETDKEFQFITEYDMICFCLYEPLTLIRIGDKKVTLTLNEQLARELLKSLVFNHYHLLWLNTTHTASQPDTAKEDTTSPG